MSSTKENMCKGAATAAAVVAAVGGASAADASVVYSGPVNQTISFLADNSNSDQAIAIDLDSMSATPLSGVFGVLPSGAELLISKSHPNSLKFTASGGKVVGGPAARYDDPTSTISGAAKLGGGVTVGSSSGFASGSTASLAYSLIADGALFPIYLTAWDAGATNEFVGFQFKRGADTFYGWARLSLVERQAEPGQWIGNSTDSFTLVDFAYESTPGASLVTGAVPEPGSAALGALALGALAVRRRNKVA